VISTKKDEDVECESFKKKKELKRKRIDSLSSISESEDESTIITKKKCLPLPYKKIHSDSYSITDKSRNYKDKSYHKRHGGHSSSYKKHSNKSSWGRGKCDDKNTNRNKSRYNKDQESKEQKQRQIKQERQRQVEERRVVHVGKIQEGTLKDDLRKRFQVFGPISDISLHFRDHGENYGFVTFQYKVDAYAAVEHGNDDTSQPIYDLCFGGRRAFCKEKYYDMDDVEEKDESEEVVLNFDELLKRAKQGSTTSS